MRRFLPTIFLVTLLVACARPGDLPQEEVMERMILANQTLRSARFSGTAQFSGLPLLPLAIENGEVDFEGAIQDAGRQLEMTIDVRGSRAKDNGDSLSINADIIVLDSREVYLKIAELSLSDSAVQDPGAQLSSLLGETWWSLTPPVSSDAVPISPDPAYLRMQAETVRIVKDHGITDLSGRDVYLYDVEIDPEKFRSFLALQPSGSGVTLDTIPWGEGTLWIDASTFVLYRARWNIVMEQDATLRIDVVLRNHQEPVAIEPPQQALPFPTIGTDTLFLTD